MKIYSMFLSTLPVIAFMAHAMGPVSNSNQTALLIKHIVTCDSAAFAQAFDISKATLTSEQLTELSTLVHAMQAQKKDSSANYLGKKWQRSLIALRSIGLAIMGTAGFFAFINGLSGGALSQQYTWQQDLVFGLLLTVTCVSSAIQDINYVCFAGTHQLTKEIAALDAILACLNPQNPESIDAKNN